VDPISKEGRNMAEIRHYHYTKIEATDVDMEGAEKVKLRMVIGPDAGAPNFYMRIFEIAPGGNTPYHSHEFEHENYVMDGKGEVRYPDGHTEPVGPGDIVFVPPNVKHQYRNAGDDTFRFICLVPKTD
jgi:quercetin dioxygenase-like cupin family protein